MKKYLLLSLTLLFTTSAWADMAVTIDPTELSNNERYPNVIHIPGVTGGFYKSNTFTIADGDYEVKTGADMNAVYGTINVNGASLTVTGGALIKTGTDVITFDLAQLGRVELDSSELGSMVTTGDPKMPAVIAMTGVNNNIKSNQYNYLPDYTGIEIKTRSNALYGTFDLVNGEITNVQGRIYQDDSNLSRIHFDRDKLLPVRVMSNELSSPEKKVKVVLSEVAGGTLSDYIVFIPPGTHKLVTRYGDGLYGYITIDEYLNLSVDGYLAVKGDNITSSGINHTEISADFTSIPHIDMYWSELSSPAGLVTGQIYQMAEGARDIEFTRYFVPDMTTAGNPVTYRFSKFDGATHNVYGDVTLSTTDFPVTTGHLTTTESEIHVDTCSLNKISFNPISSSYRALPWFSSYTNEPVSIFAPSTGARFLVQTGAESIIVTVSENGVESDTDISDILTITSEMGHCIPPDSDEDSVLDDMDECPDTLAGAQVDAYGCSVNQNIALTCDATKSKNHGRYVSCVSHVLDDLIEQSMITQDDKGTIMSETAKNK